MFLMKMKIFYLIGMLGKNNVSNMCNLRYIFMNPLLPRGLRDQGTHASLPSPNNK
jgi:hypothetical protein